jgi:hypothetical protein
VLELYNGDVKFKTEFDKCVKESIKTEIIDRANGVVAVEPVSREEPR